LIHLKKLFKIELQIYKNKKWLSILSKQKVLAFYLRNFKSETV